MKLLMLMSCLCFGAQITASGYKSVGVLAGEAVGDQFGTAMTMVDFNGDGYLDLAISASAADDAGLSSGKVYLYYGGPSADTIADKRLIGVASSFFGKAMASAGDFNSDGYDDFLVGAPFYDLPATSAGAAFLFYGGPSADSIPDHIFTGEAGGDYFGYSVAGIGDFNNDGNEDIAVGAFRADWGSFTGAGKVYVYYGGPSPNFVADRLLVGSADGERFGCAISGGELNGDGLSDIAVGAYSYDDGLLNRGRIYLHYGGTSPDTLYDLSITGPAEGNKFGWSLTTARINDDSFFDLIMGTDGFAVDTFATGQVYSFFGGPTIDAVADAAFSLNRQGHDYLGYSVASGVDITGDGRHDIITGAPGRNDAAVDGGGVTLLAGGTPLVVDTTILGAVTNEQLGQSVALWPHFGSESSIAIAAGSQSIDSYRGHVRLYRTNASNGGECCDGIVGNIDCSADNNIDLSDLTTLIDNLYISFSPLCCPAEADCDGDSGVDISDITRMIDYLYISFAPLPACP
jgi:hypothetical protein